MKGKSLLLLVFSLLLVLGLGGGIGGLWEEARKLGFLEEEKEDRGDHYSFWRGCNLPRLWDRSWGPFGPRRR